MDPSPAGERCRGPRYRIEAIEDPTAVISRPLRCLLAATTIAVVLPSGSAFGTATAPPQPTAAVAAAGAAAGATTPTATDDGTTPPTVAPGKVPVADPQNPTAEELEAQRREAERLQAEISTQEQTVESARARAAELSEQAGAALEAYEGAVQQRDDALTERDLQSARLAEAQQLLVDKRADLGRWASQAYRDGTTMGEYEELMTLLESDTTDDLSRRMALLRVVGRVKGEVVVTVDNAEQVARESASRARVAALQADAATERAAAARARADALLAAQQEQLTVLDDLLADTQDAAEVAGDEADKLAAARRVAEERRKKAMEEAQAAALAAGATAEEAASAVVGEVGDCAGGDISRYPNGGIPRDKLCPLWGAPGHVMRADAAHAFDQMSRAYAKQFGSPICVTDSYRTYASQVRLRASKPTLAAKPGTSNHGWGKALDLCDGIQDFGTPTHEWMRANAPRFGFFHPSWAQQNGSKPEAWHWQFGG